MIAILKYNAGNIKSVQNALIRLGYESIITDIPSELTKADKVIFPGVGEASSAMQYLTEKGLDKTILSLRQPVLGICLGLQLMCRYSEEADTKCLGIFDADVKLFPPVDKIPHMGWNNCMTLRGELFKGLTVDDDLYFVHSYYAEISSHTSATCDYIVPFSAAMQKDNFFATQFHPEKSAGKGEILLQNFLKL
jgi:imidazole glycerol-phosphate synthase subunit HisH